MALGKKTGGRKKGVQNKTTVAVKEALQSTFDEIGGVNGLVNWAKQEPTEFYKLWGKLLPTEVKADVGGQLQVAVNIGLKCED